MSNAVPKNWCAASLGELCTFSGGSAFKEKYQGKSSGRFPFIKVSDMNLIGNERFIRNAKHWIDESIRVEAKVKLFPPSSVVFAKVGAALLLNRRRILVRSTAIDNNMMAAIPNSNDNHFLYYFLQEVDLGRIVQGGAVPSVNQAQMEDMPALIPPLPEQQKIATILSSVDDVIEKTRAQIDKLKDLKTGMMQELLTKGIGHTEFKDSPVGRIPASWKVKPLEELVKPNKKITYGIVQAGPHCEGGIPYIRVSDMTQRALGLNGMLRTSLEIAKKYNRSAVSAGDIVYALRGMIGHVHIVPVELDGANLTQGTARVSPTDRVSPRYCLWAMKSPYVQHQNELEAKGSTFREVTLASLRKIEIALPPLVEQTKIASAMDSIESKIFAAENKLEQFKNLKKALMQDLLTGKVRVNLQQKEPEVA